MVHVRPHSRGTENKQLNLSMKLAKALDKHLDLFPVKIILLAHLLVRENLANTCVYPIKRLMLRTDEKLI